MLRELNKFLINNLRQKQTASLIRCLTTESKQKDLVKKLDATQENQEKQEIIIRKDTVKEEKSDEKKKGPFDYYFEDEERDTNLIKHNLDFFDKSTKVKNRQNFIVICI
jgi:hypothetical protein